MSNEGSNLQRCLRKYTKASRIVYLKGRRQEDLSTSSLPLLVEGFSRHANNTALASCPLPGWSQMSAWGTGGIPEAGKQNSWWLLSAKWVQVFKELFIPAIWIQGVDKGLQSRTLGWRYKVISVYTNITRSLEWLKRLNRRKCSLSHFKWNHLDNHPLYPLANLILTP